MEDGNVHDIIIARWKQADECVLAAKVLLSNELISAALNRIYYGMFYVISALAAANGFHTSKHHQLLAWFNREFIATGKVSAELGKLARNAFRKRMEADYEAFVEFGSDTVEELIPQMESFIAEMKKLLSNQ